MVPTPKASCSNKAIAACVVDTVPVAVLIVPYLFAAMFSVMMFDAPGADRNPWTWLAFTGVVSVPLLLLLSVGVSWVLLLKSRHGAAFWVSVMGSGLAVVPAGLFLLFILLDG
jgi:hypothetical protein